MSRETVAWVTTQPDAREGGDQLLLRPDPQPLDEARDELLTVGLAQLVLRLHGAQHSRSRLDPQARGR